MRPSRNARRLLGITRSRAKMWEFRVPERYHIDIPEDPTKVFDLAVSALGDIAAAINGESPSDSQDSDSQTAIRFASQFFDSYVASKLDESLTPFGCLCASASYYLCDLPGSSILMAGQIDPDSLDLDAGSLDRLLLWLLRPPPADLPTAGLRGISQRCVCSLILISAFPQPGGILRP